MELADPNGSGPPERPYLSLKIWDLEKLAEAHWDDQAILCEILMELGVRRGRRAGHLRDRVVARFNELITAQSEASLARMNELAARLAAESFRWPSTEAPESHEPIPAIEAPETGVLLRMGYQVGRNGARDAVRHELLSCIYEHPVVFVNSPKYMQEWGSPGTASRLRKMAESIAAFARNAKRKAGGDYSDAIADWEGDLAFLKREYYDGVYDFTWPRTDPL